MHAGAGRLALDAQLTDARAAQLLANLPGDSGVFILRIKFLREHLDEGSTSWIIKDKFDPVRAERKKEHSVIEVSWDTKPGALVGIDSLFYKDAYPVSAVVYGLYPVLDPDPANLVPLKDSDLNCVTQCIIEHFNSALRGPGFTEARRQKIAGWEERVHETSATVADVAELKHILKRAIILRDIAGEDIYNSSKYRLGGSGVRGKVDLIVHNGHAWRKDLHFP